MGSIGSRFERADLRAAAAVVDRGGVFVNAFPAADGCAVGDAEDDDGGLRGQLRRRLGAGDPVRAEPADRAQPSSIRGRAAGHPHRRHRAAHPDLGRRRSRRTRGVHPGDHRRLLPHSVECQFWPALGRSGIGRPVPALSRLARSAIVAAAIAQRLARVIGRRADQRRAGADRQRGCGIRRRLRRGDRTCLAHRRKRQPPGNPPHVRGPGPAVADRAGAERRHRLA